MSPYKYYSELFPLGYDDYITEEILKLPTKELEEKHTKLLAELNNLRAQEPAKKRNKKDEYRIWVQSTHNLRDRLNAIAQELERRNSKTI